MNEASYLLFDNQLDPRNWTEDFSHENGRYMNSCLYCLGKFVGHKRRVSCRECFDKPMEEIDKSISKEDLKESFNENIKRQQKLVADCFNPAETDEQYFLRRKKDLGLESYYKPLEGK